MDKPIRITPPRLGRALLGLLLPFRSAAFLEGGSNSHRGGRKHRNGFGIRW
ncbi:hypothetical protein L0222_08070 [bacterium]|nr:hypothetical protein [bacterium]MCI0607285.1 hypothetical protein [bacterium]